MKQNYLNLKKKNANLQKVSNLICYKMRWSSLPWKLQYIVFLPLQALDEKQQLLDKVTTKLQTLEEVWL